MKTLMLNCREEQRHCHRHPWVSMPDGLAAPLVFNATDQTSGPVICSYKTGWGSQGQGVRGDIMDRSAGLASGCFSFSSTQCRSLLLSFSTCYLGIYIRSWGGYKLHTGSNLPPKDNLRREDKSYAPKVFFIQSFHCIPRLLVSKSWVLWALSPSVLLKRICYFDDCISHQNCNCWHGFMGWY